MKKNVLVTFIAVIILFLTTVIILYSKNYKPEIKVPDDNNGELGDIVEEKTEDDMTEIIEQNDPIENPSDEELPIEAKYDVIVFGAEPEGISAAISSARNGLKVLLVEQRDGLGGLMTYGMLNTIDMNTNKDGELLSKGIFEEFFNKIERKGSFDVKKAKQAFEEMINNEKNITTMYNAKDIFVGSNKEEIKYIKIDNKKYIAKRYIDCTQDADIAVMAGVPHTIGWEDINEKNRSMSATLVIEISGVNWEKIRTTLENDKDPGTGCSDNGAWGFGNITKKYVPKQTHIRLKALNIGRQDNNNVLINSLQILNVNMLDPIAKQKGYEKCKAEAENVAKFLKENVPGFENSKLESVAPELYVRQTRHIIGEYKLTVKDILESTNYNDKIASASYPIDVQTTSIYDWGYIIGVPDQYYIRFGTIVPKGYKNLLVVGRSGSYTSIAAGSARVIPTGMSLAESAGIITAVSIEKDMNFQQMLDNYSINQDLQLRFKLQGVYIGEKSKPVVDVNGRYYAFIIEMCEKGILGLGYNNTFNAEEKVSEKDFIVLVKTYLKRSFIREELWNTEHINLLDASDEGISPNRAKEIIYDITTYKLKDEDKKEKIEDFLNIVIPTGTESLSIVRVYEILIVFKNYLISSKI